MGKQVRISAKGTSLARNDRDDLFIDGYPAPMVASFQGALDASEENTPVFGLDGTIDTRVLNSGALTLSGYEHPAMRPILDVLKGINPGQVGIRAYKASGMYNGVVVRNVKHPTRSYYIASDFFLGWNTVLGPKEGEVKGAGVYTLPGKCDIPINFAVRSIDGNYVAVSADIAALTAGSGSLTSLTALTAIPDEIEELAGKYALAVEIQKRNASTNKIEKSARLNVTDAMVSVAGAVVISLNDIQGTNFDTLAEATHAHVYVLLSGSAPAVGTEKLLGDGIDLRGRWDTAT